MGDKELAQALYQAGLLTEEQIRAAAEQRTPESSFTDVVVRNGWVTLEQIDRVTGTPSAATSATDTPWSNVPPAGVSAPPMPNIPPPAAPPPYSPPIPEPTGYTSGGSGQTPPFYGGSGMPPSPRPGMVSTDAIGEAWALLKPNIGIWIGAVIIVAIISGMFSGLQQAILPKQANGSPQIGPAWALLTLISVIINQILGAGMQRMAIENVRTGRAELTEMFNIGSVIGNILIAALLTSIITLLGVALCIIPGVIAALGLSMTNMLIIDQKLDAMAAMTRSWEVMKSRVGAMFVLGLVLALINIAGVFACCVGVLVTGALTQLTLAIVYRDVFYGTSPTPLQNAS